MQINDNILQNSEKILFKLRELYLNNGYTPYRMSKFEEYDLYAKNKDFLISDNVITFTDTNGKLMALKPDVTLSIIKNSIDTTQETQKVFYNENVYRVSKGTNAFREILQSGVECFGKVENQDVIDIIKLAVKSLFEISSSPILELSDIDIIENIINSLNVSGKVKNDLYIAISEKNIPEINNIAIEENDQKKINEIIDLLSINEKLEKAKNILCDLYNKYQNEDIKKFINILESLESFENKDIIKVDFSCIGDINYYNSILFKGFIPNIPNAVLSGGQYDKLMKKMHRKAKAIGFAVYTDSLERIDDIDENTDEYINIALPKGRLGEKVYNFFSKAGYECPSILEENRKLIFENEEKKVRYFWVKPSDVAIYVERGAADIGVAGKDILLEYSPDVYELLDLNLGKCFMAVAGSKDFVDDNNRTLKVATKFSNIAKRYYQSLGRDIDIIHLNGSIEIAPILGLSDVIVDIVETGSTLKENNLEVKTKILPISARLISNKASEKFKNKKIKELVSNLSEVLEKSND